jgi:hypothetical protein
LVLISTIISGLSLPQSFPLSVMILMIIFFLLPHLQGQLLGGAGEAEGLADIILQGEWDKEVDGAGASGETENEVEIEAEAEVEMEGMAETEIEVEGVPEREMETEGVAEIEMEEEGDWLVEPDGVGASGLTDKVVDGEYEMEIEGVDE